MHEDGSLGPDAPADALVPLQWGWRQWLEGVEAPAWTSEPLEGATLVTAATATIVYTATAPVTTLAQRPEWTVWFGAEDMVVDHSFQPGPPALLPGETAIVTFELALPVGGLVVAAGERLVLRVGSYYDDDAARGAVAVTMGGADFSRLDLVTLALPPWEPAGASVVTDHSVTLTGGRCLGLDAATDQDLVWIPIEADASKGRLIEIDITVDRTGGEGPPDVDLVFVDATGEAIAHAAGSAGHERLRLRETNLAVAMLDEPSQLGVYSCTPQRATAEVSIRLGYAG